MPFYGGCTCFLVLLTCRWIGLERVVCVDPNSLLGLLSVWMSSDTFLSARLAEDHSHMFLFLAFTRMCNGTGLPDHSTRTLAHHGDTGSPMCGPRGATPAALLSDCRCACPPTHPQHSCSCVASPRHSLIWGGSHLQWLCFWLRNLAVTYTAHLQTPPTTACLDNVRCESLWPYR